MVGFFVILEMVGFVIMVGLDVGVVFYMIFYMVFVLFFFGVRKVMISVVVGLVAFILVGVVKNYGFEYVGVVIFMVGVL